MKLQFYDTLVTYCLRMTEGRQRRLKEEIEKRGEKGIERGERGRRQRIRGIER